MDKVLGQEYLNPKERIDFLKANCDHIEEFGYMKQFSPEEVISMKEDLSEVSIKINDIEEEKKIITDQFKDVLKPLNEDRKELLTHIKNGAEYVSENCYKFLDESEKMVGYYNSEGVLVSQRPARPEELQTTMVSMTRRTGTNN